MAREGAAGFRHLHQAEHAFVHARAAGRRDDDHGRCSSVPYSIAARDSFADDRAHRRREKTEIHHRDGDFVAFDHSVPAEDGVGQPGALLIFFEAIFVSGHALKSQGVDRSQIGIRFDEPFRVEQLSIRSLADCAK